MSMGFDGPPDRVEAVCVFLLSNDFEKVSQLVGAEPASRWQGAGDMKRGLSVSLPRRSHLSPFLPSS